MFDKCRLNGYNKQCIGLGVWIKASSKADICVFKIRRNAAKDYLREEYNDEKSSKIFS